MPSLLKQLGNLGFALVVLGFAAFFPLHWLRKLAVPVIVVAILGLLLSLLLSVGGGPRRAILGGSVQPSEMATLALIIYLAVWMESKGDRLSEWGYGFLPLMMILGIVDGLVLLQPDLSGRADGGDGGAGDVLPGGRQDGAVAGHHARGRGDGLHPRPPDAHRPGALGSVHRRADRRRSRPPTTCSTRCRRCTPAASSAAGWAPAARSSACSRRRTPTSIFAIIGEELGLLGAVLVIVLFALLMVRGFRIAHGSPDKLTQLLAAGITFYIGIQALINMSVLLGLLPFAGNALPFFSYGGSNLTSTLAAIGILLNISRRKPLEVGPIDYAATVGIGWRNRRRRVSRLSHSRRPARSR